MASINDLPDELLVEIFSAVDLAQLGNLRLVCHRWNFVIVDPTTWQRAFSRTFGAHRHFPQIRANLTWMGEYYHRLKCIRLWSKARGTHVSYQLINNDLRYVDHVLADFDANGGYGKLLTASSTYGSISWCNLTNGRHQGFVPWRGTALMEAFATNWHWSVAGVHDELVIRNLKALSTRGNATVIAKRNSTEITGHKFTAIAINPSHSSAKQGPDIATATSGGTIELWSLQGKSLATIGGDEPIIHLKSDFANYILYITTTKLVVRSFKSPFDIIATHDLPHPLEGEYLDHFATFHVDFAGQNAIFSHGTNVKVYHFGSLPEIEERTLQMNGNVVLNEMQSIPPERVQKLGSQDTKVPGGDALYFATVLDTGSVVVWNCRSAHTTIIPQCEIAPPYFGKHYPQLSDDISPVTSVAINAAVVVVGGYRGYFNVYDVFTGNIIKSEASVKYPRKFREMFDELVPISAIKLDNRDQSATHGVVVSGQFVQYFRFGDHVPTPSHRSAPKRRNVAREAPINRQISDGIDEYDRELYNRRQEEALVEKYNGSDLDVDEELRVALALSASQPSTDSDLERAIAASREESLTVSAVEDDEEEDEELRRALELSLLES
ncbi:hypothetical protein DIURU_005422 [Diutina rugosa]|uniref:F-box domain-containing protein n=1 Tax=Diutina rugosa TaxID=5481 RepID=A0A642UDM4_DIURU|nr:uncharacterized protein DIURU_005422 [Diutina rugosa]KAA8897189.1 hypothetical protein DIURU_005422 [Diutina rugosa]